MQSLWSDTAQLPSFPSLSGPVKTDVLIIGGGIAGILCAHALANVGVNYILVEAGEICSGITKNTTAKITAQHGLIYRKMVEKLGLERAQMYLQANDAALQEYRRICNGIPCNFQETDSFVYDSQRQALEQELEALERLHFSASLAEHLPIPVSNASAICFPHQAQFHPLQFLASVARDLNIYENTAVKELKGFTAVTDAGRIRADRIIVATHFPFLNKHGSFFLKMYQQRSYVLALENAQKVDGMYIGAQENSLSFRNYDNLLLLGGGGHRTGKTGGNWAQLRSFSEANYPGAKMIYQWATQDCMTLDGLPYIGQYSRNTPNLYVITGFNKWGMTNAMAGAMVLRDRILGKESPWAEVFSPSRSILHPQLFINAGEAACNLLRFPKKRCPHMGCALKWNPQEHSWDCPCHGSRFTQAGKLIDNPATGDLPAE